MVKLNSSTEGRGLICVYYKNHSQQQLNRTQQKAHVTSSTFVRASLNHMFLSLAPRLKSTPPFQDLSLGEYLARFSFFFLFVWSCLRSDLPEPRGHRNSFPVFDGVFWMEKPPKKQGERRRSCFQTSVPCFQSYYRPAENQRTLHNLSHFSLQFFLYRVVETGWMPRKGKFQEPGGVSGNRQSHPEGEEEGRGSPYRHLTWHRTHAGMHARHVMLHEVNARERYR